MLRLTNEQRAEAAFLIHQGILAGEDQYEILARLGEDFDVEPMESWPEDDLEQRAIDAALAKSPKPTSWTKIL